MTKTAPAVEQVNPACECHGEPMRLHRRGVGRGATLECRVKHRLNERERYRRDPAPRLAYQSAYYQQNREKDLDRKREEYRKRKAILDRYKTLKGCTRCGYREHPGALQFHHRNPIEKSNTVGAFLRAGMKAVKREMAKCDLLCANCHAILHAEDAYA